ncbi:hypothetical protein Kole_1138 [Kosmotoga olearia TBF 19.5.1]|uniref:Uncharacterized protein n=1 Tax=Kosmotoga olearia (strain ATCC BAA-1733 / DSM 21960 / TBF 19.5.1) TaxID=521045 RepID=C5CIH7_KOSOT|nr:hypothetical protein Kole_1138 [Kosmotoga olearia TBF 19.5.1]
MKGMVDLLRNNKTDVPEIKLLKMVLNNTSASILVVKKRLCQESAVKISLYPKTG